MRVALVQSTPFPPEEGLSTFVWNLARELRGAGHEPMIFTRGSMRKTTSIEHDGIRVNFVRFTPLHPFHVPAHAPFMQRALRAEGPFDVLHLHSPLPPPVRHRGPSLVTFHTPVVADTQAINTRNLTSTLYRLQTPISARVERALIARCDAVSAVSASVAADLQPYGLAPDKVIILPNGVDPAAFPASDGPREDFLLYTGRLGPRKGLPELLRAVQLLARRGRRVALTITGRGPFLAELQRQARELRIDDRVTFAGFVSREELGRLLRRCAVFVFPSHYEGLPTSVLEAMSSAAPIVATHAPGVRDLLEENRTALLARVGDAEHLCARIVEALDDWALRARLGAAARAEVEARYAWSSIARQALHIYSGLTLPAFSSARAG